MKLASTLKEEVEQLEYERTQYEAEIQKYPFRPTEILMSVADLVKH